MHERADIYGITSLKKSIVKITILILLSTLFHFPIVNKHIVVFIGVNN